MTKFSILGYEISILRPAKEDSAHDEVERRIQARKVLEVCNHSDSVVERIKAVRKLGPPWFPDLDGYVDPDTCYCNISLKAAMNWVMGAFSDHGHGDPL